MVEVAKKVASELELLLMMRIGEPINRVPNEKMDDFIKSSDSSSQLAVGRFIRWHSSLSQTLVSSSQVL